MFFKSKMTVNSGPCRLHARWVDRIWGRMDGSMGWMDGWPAWGEDRNAWSLDGLVMPCWLLEGQVVDDEVNAGSGSRPIRRSASSYQRVGVGFGSRWAVEDPVLVRMRR